MRQARFVDFLLWTLRAGRFGAAFSLGAIYLPIRSKRIEGNEPSQRKAA
jgi:hypothetical protein